MPKHDGWPMPAAGDEILIIARVQRVEVVNGPHIVARIGGKDGFDVRISTASIHSIVTPDYKHGDTVEYDIGLPAAWRQGTVVGAHERYVVIVDRYMRGKPQVVEFENVRRCAPWDQEVAEPAAEVKSIVPAWASDCELVEGSVLDQYPVPKGSSWLRRRASGLMILVIPETFNPSLMDRAYPAAWNYADEVRKPSGTGDFKEIPF